jgi:hypothetical protein
MERPEHWLQTRTEPPFRISSFNGGDVTAMIAGEPVVRIRLRASLQAIPYHFCNNNNTGDMTTENGCPNGEAPAGTLWSFFSCPGSRCVDLAYCCVGLRDHSGEGVGQFLQSPAF